MYKTFLTNSAIEKLESGKYQDIKIQSLHINVTSKGTKSWFIYKSHQGRPFRMTLGRYPDLNVTLARNKAQGILAELAMGNNPKEEKKQNQVEMEVEKWEGYLRKFLTHYSYNNSIKYRELHDIKLYEIIGLSE